MLLSGILKGCSLADKKGAGLSTETLAKIILLLGFLVVVAFIISAVTGLFSISSAEKSACYVANALTSSNLFFKALMPSACSIELVNEPVDEEKLASLLKDTWWMYGKGDWDMGNVGYSAFSPFGFKPKQDIPIMQLYNYLQSHREGKSVTDRSKSDYDYLQKGSYGQTLCFARGMFQEGHALKLDANQLYYINFYDEQRRISGRCGDKIFISKEGGFHESGLLEEPNFLACFSPETNKYLIVAETPLSEAELISPMLGLISDFFSSEAEGTYCTINEGGGR